MPESLLASESVSMLAGPTPVAVIDFTLRKPDSTQTNQLQQRIEELARAYQESTEKYERLKQELQNSESRRDRTISLPGEADDASSRLITMPIILGRPPQDCLVTSSVKPLPY